MGMHQIEILQIIVPNLRFWYKIAFSANLKLTQRHGGQKTGLTVKMAFGGENLAVKG